MKQYVGIPYDLHNINGLSCWGLVAKVCFDRGISVPEYKAENHRQVAAAFTLAFAEGMHGFIQVYKPVNYDVIIMKSRQNEDGTYRLIHCGVWYQGKVLHANNGAKQVMFQRFKDVIKPFKEIEFWRK